MRLNGGKLKLSWDRSSSEAGNGHEVIGPDQWESAARNVTVQGKMMPSSERGGVQPFSGLVLVGEETLKPKQDGTFQGSVKGRGWVAVRPLPGMVPDFPVGTRTLLEPTTTKLDVGSLEIYWDEH